MSARGSRQRAAALRVELAGDQVGLLQGPFDGHPRHREKWTREVVATTRTMRTVMANVSLALQAGTILGAISMKFVVQSLEADPQDSWPPRPYCC